MDQDPAITQVARLAALLGEAGAAHGRYEEEALGGVYDQQWAEWYARYLADHGFYTLLGVTDPADRPALAEWLAAADASHRAHAPGEPWSAYYARYFLAGLPAGG